jgi:hypothetical protein
MVFRRRVISRNPARRCRRGKERNLKAFRVIDNRRRVSGFGPTGNTNAGENKGRRTRDLRKVLYFKSLRLRSKREDSTNRCAALDACLLKITCRIAAALR